MLDIGSYPVRTCAGVSRRSFLRVAASAPLALGVSGAARLSLAAQAKARAKSVIFVFLWGGPSHLDTCDPKPDAPAEYRGPFGVIPTRTPGVYFTELVPQLAERSHRFSLIRTHVTTNSAHPPAGTLALTGFDENPLPVQPNFGSIVARSRGQASIENRRAGGVSPLMEPSEQPRRIRGLTPPARQAGLPPFFSLARGVLMDSQFPIKGYGGGKLGAGYDPFMVGCSEQGEINIPALQLPNDLNPARISDRKTLLAQVDQAARSIESAGLHSWERTYQQAYSLLLEPSARAAFDLTRETSATRGRYGYTVFGQSALLARRLVEAGVPYVQLNYSRHPEAINPGFEFGWDTHIYNFELLADQHCPIFDRAFSALLDDLYARGLIDQTLVVCMGEFGRTPKINNRASRDHWPRCYFSLWSGAGLPPGRVLGSSDRLGEEPRGDPVTPLMVGTTIVELAGIDTQARAELGVLPEGKVIEGLL